MPLSSRIIKSMQANSKESNDWVIDTAYDYEEDPEDSYEETSQDAADELAQARKKVISSSR